MQIIVCVKQVPASNAVKLNKETNTLIREGVEAVINPFDTYAIEEGLRLKQRYGGKVTAVSMGIPSVAELLQQTMALGVDEAVLLSDRRFAGADSLATAWALAGGIGKIGDFDLIICGKQATDGDTAQVGPSLAEKLGIPHTTYVRSIEHVDESTIRCIRLTDDGQETVEMTLPAVITVLKDINVPRLPSIRGLREARSAAVKVFGAHDIQADEARIGLKGSPTQVVKTFVPERTTESEILEGTTAEQARQLVDRLVARQLVQGGEANDRH